MALRGWDKIGLLNKNPYTVAGLGLLIAGSLVSPLAYFILALTWLTALGICMLILSLILLVLGRTIPKLPPEVCGLLLETGIDNMATIVEELGIRTKAIYLPSSLTNGRPQALIPLHSNPSLPPINKALPHRLIVRYGASPDDIGLLLSQSGVPPLVCWSQDRVPPQPSLNRHSLPCLPEYWAWLIEPELLLMKTISR